MTDREAFLKCAKEAGIELRSRTITRIYDYSQVVVFLRSLMDYNISLGMDMSTFTCSGNVKFEFEESKYIRLLEMDNGCVDYFKFQSLFIINYDLENVESYPDMYFEASEDVEWLKKYEDEGYKISDSQIGTYLGLYLRDDHRVVYDRKSIQEYMDMLEQSYVYTEVNVPKIQRYIRNTKPGMLVYVNLQESNKIRKGDTIIQESGHLNGDEFLERYAKKIDVI